MSARYSSRTGYTVSKRTTRRATVRTVQQRVKLGPTTAKYLGLSILAVLALIGLSQSSKDAVTGYTQTDLRKQQSLVDQDTERLKLEAKRARSLSSIQQSEALKNGQLQTAGQIDFVNRDDTQGQVAGVSATASPSASPVVSSSPTATP